MRTSQVIDIRRTFDQNVSDVVHVLMAARRMNATGLVADGLLPQSTVYARLKAEVDPATGRALSPWKASEIAQLARYFAVSPLTFYEPVDTLLESVHAGAAGDLVTFPRRRGGSGRAWNNSRGGWPTGII